MDGLQPNLVNDINDLTTHLVSPDDPALWRYVHNAVTPETYVPDEMVLMHPHNAQPYYSTIPMVPDHNLRGGNNLPVGNSLIGFYDANGVQPPRPELYNDELASVSTVSSPESGSLPMTMLLGASGAGGIPLTNQEQQEQQLLLQQQQQQQRLLNNSRASASSGGSTTPDEDSRPKGGGKAKKGRGRKKSATKETRIEKQRLASKTYRERRKQYVETLENENTELKLENARLKNALANEGERSRQVSTLARENAILLAALRASRIQLGCAPPDSARSVVREQMKEHARALPEPSSFEGSVTPEMIQGANNECLFCGDFNVETLQHLNLTLEQLNTIDRLRSSFCSKLSKLRAERETANTLLREQFQGVLPTWSRLKILGVVDSNTAANDPAIMSLKAHIEQLKRTMVDEAEMIDATVEKFYKLLNPNQQRKWDELIADRKHSRFLVLCSVWAITGEGPRIEGLVCSLDARAKVTQSLCAKNDGGEGKAGDTVMSEASATTTTTTATTAGAVPDGGTAT